MSFPSPRQLNALAEFRSEHSLAKELPYWEFLEDAVVLADGTLASGMSLTGIPIEAMDAARINRITADIRALLNSLPDGCELSIVTELTDGFRTVIDSHAELKGKRPVINWLTEVRTDALREEVRKRSLLKPELRVFIYRRLRTGQHKKKLSFFSPPTAFIQATTREHKKALKELHQTRELVASCLQSAGVACQALSAQEVWHSIYRFLNPSRAETHPAPLLHKQYAEQEFTKEELGHVPELAYPSPREQLAFSDIICRYDCLFYDGYFHRCISLKSLPESTHSALISRLMELPFPYYLQIHLKVPEQSAELAALQAKRRMAHSMALPSAGRAADLESEARLNSAEDLIRDLLNTGQKIFLFEGTVLVKARSREELERRTNAVLAKFRELNGAEAQAETVANLKVWKTLLPLGNTTMVRPKRIKTDNLADFLPLYQPYRGSRRPVCLFRNRHGGITSYDPFDPALPNYNTLVTGSSGAGKSFVNNLILLQYASQDPAVYIIDIGGSYRKVCELLGGRYIDISPPDSDNPGTPINPFLLAPGEREPSPRKLKFLVALLESILTDEKHPHLGKLERSRLEETILTLYQRHPDKAPRLSDLAALLAASKEQPLKDYSRMLYPWTGNRPFGRLLDSTESLPMDNEVVVFDLKGLSSYPDLQAVMLLIITDFILESMEKAKGQTKRIFMDECWELLKSPGSRSFMEYCVRTLRKTGSGITFITQGLEEIVTSPIGPAILSNTATKFVLMQRGDLAPIRNTLKLNEQETELIGSLHQSKGTYSEAFLMVDRDRAVIRIHPTSPEYWIATSDAADNQSLAEYRSAHPDKSLAECIYDLAKQYPWGLSGG